MLHGSGGPSRGGALMRTVEMLGLVLGVSVALVAAPAMYQTLDPYVGPLILQFYGNDLAPFLRFVWGVVCFVICVLLIRISVLAMWLLFAFGAATFGPRLLPAVAG